MIKIISIKGFRGFGEKQNINFSIPNGKDGSGLSILVGANNCGKTSILEAIKSFNGNESPSFSVGKRNLKSGDYIELVLEKDDGKTVTIRTIGEGGSSTIKDESDRNNFYILQSRRFVEYQFGKGSQSRDDYLLNFNTIGNGRTSQLNQFYLRLFEMQKHKEDFNRVLKRILGDDLIWTIDQNDSGQYFIKFTFNGESHNSEGLGDGIWSIFTICDALYDSSPNNTIAIDEPELSLHPAFQKKLINVIMEYSRDRQIILSTHSPYFINWSAIVNGASLTRAIKSNDGNIYTYQISAESRTNINGLLRDLNNPHTLGLEANEAFFLDDKIILVEGQEDVVIFQKVCNSIKKEFCGNFFGWGVGGAPKMKMFLQLFKDLGYKKVISIFDGDKIKDMEEAKSLFPEYNFFVLPTEDIRDKKQRTINYKSGITKENGQLKTEYKSEIENLIDEANKFLQ